MLMGTATEVRARAVSLDIFERFSRILDGYHFHQVRCLNLFTRPLQNSCPWRFWLDHPANAPFVLRTFPPWTGEPR